MPLAEAYNSTERKMLAPKELSTLSWMSGQTGAHISARFVPSSDGERRVVVSRSDSDAEEMTVYNLDSGLVEASWDQATDDGVQSDTAGLSPGGRYVAFRKQTGNEASLAILPLNQSYLGRSAVSLPAMSSQIVSVQFSPGSDYVLASASNPAGTGRAISQEVFSSHMGANGALEEPRFIAKASLGPNPDRPATALPESGYMLAYVTITSQLHAVFLDGTGDTKVEENVGAVWSLQARSDLSWSRSRLTTSKTSLQGRSRRGIPPCLPFLFTTDIRVRQ